MFLCLENCPSKYTFLINKKIKFGPECHLIWDVFIVVKKGIETKGFNI